MDTAQDAGVVVLQAVLSSLGDLPPADTEASAVDQIALLESAKAACAAAQAQQTMRLEELRLESEAAAGVPKARQGRGLAAEVALASRPRGQSAVGTSGSRER